MDELDQKPDVTGLLLVRRVAVMTLRIVNLILVVGSVDQEGSTFKETALEGYDPVTAQFLVETASQDMLRAAVVMCHAMLEDTLRVIGQIGLADAPEEVINRIPWVGLWSPGTPSRAALGVLAQHRGKTVDEVIQESIAEHLERTSFTSTTQISGFLSSIGIDMTELRNHLPEIEQMIQRRHQIVHSMDIVTAEEDWEVEPISVEDVMAWAVKVQEFLKDLTLPFLSEEQKRLLDLLGREWPVVSP